MAYDPAVETEALPLTRSYQFLEANALNSDAEAIRASKDRFGSYTSTLKRAKVVMLLKDKGLLDAFIAQHWHRGATNDGQREVRRLIRIYERWQEAEETGVAAPDGDDQVEADAGGEFALEEHLRDYLEKNLHVVEEGMTLWPVGEGRQAVEFVVDDKNRRIDILASDRNGIPTVIELKVSRGHERTIGQALYYRARIKDLFNAGKVRIVIVAREIASELKDATRGLEDVSLFEYSLSMTLKKV